MPSKDKGPQLGLFDQQEAPAFESDLKLSWPAATRFPLNVDRTRTVGDQVIGDLRTSARPLLVVGYSALDHLIDLITDARNESAEMRLLLGSEPFPSKRERFELDAADFPMEIHEYWLSRGISLRLSGKVIRAQELLRNGGVKARYLGTSRSRLHAKMYCGDEAITLGSSNFTRPGLSHQIEANARFTARDGARFPRRGRSPKTFGMKVETIPWSSASSSMHCCELSPGRRPLREVVQSCSRGIGRAAICSSSCFPMTNRCGRHKYKGSRSRCGLSRR